MGMRTVTQLVEPDEQTHLRAPARRDSAVSVESEETFTECLLRLKRVSGLTTRQLANSAWLTYPYVSRLINWESNLLSPRLERRREREERHPSRDTVIRLGLAMHLPLEDMDELLMSAAYAPLVRERIRETGVMS